MCLVTFALRLDVRLVLSNGQLFLFLTSSAE